MINELALNSAKILLIVILTLFPNSFVPPTKKRNNNISIGWLAESKSNLKGIGWHAVWSFKVVLVVIRTIIVFHQKKRTIIVAFRVQRIARYPLQRLPFLFTKSSLFIKNSLTYHSARFSHPCFQQTHSFSCFSLPAVSPTAAIISVHTNSSETHVQFLLLAPTPQHHQTVNHVLS